MRQRGGHRRTFLGSEQRYMRFTWFPAPENRFAFAREDGSNSMLEPLRTLLATCYRQGTDVRILISPSHARPLGGAGRGGALGHLRGLEAAARRDQRRGGGAGRQDGLRRLGLQRLRRADDRGRARARRHRHGDGLVLGVVALQEGARRPRARPRLRHELPRPYAARRLRHPHRQLERGGPPGRHPRRPRRLAGDPRRRRRRHRAPGRRQPRLPHAPRPGERRASRSARRAKSRTEPTACRPTRGRSRPHRRRRTRGW